MNPGSNGYVAQRGRFLHFAILCGLQTMAVLTGRGFAGN
jgi:hypothetical protein